MGALDGMKDRADEELEKFAAEQKAKAEEEGESE